MMPLETMTREQIADTLAPVLLTPAQRSRVRAAAQTYALSTLTREHYVRFRELYAEELDNTDPAKSSPPRVQARHRAQRRLAVEHEDRYRCLYEQALSRPSRFVCMGVRS